MSQPRDSGATNRAIQAFIDHPRRNWIIAIVLAFSIDIFIGHAAAMPDQPVATATATDSPIADVPSDSSASVETSAPRGASSVKAAAPAATTEPYAHRRAREKQQFYASVDQSISGSAIAGNPFKYVGQKVELHCTVASVPEADAFNADCGQDSDGGEAIIVMETSTAGLDKGQAVRILGTVAQPAQGTNGMGGAAQFPTVQVEFMQ